MKNSGSASKSSKEIELLELKLEEHKRQARRELLKFVRFTKLDYQENWHHRVMCSVLDRFIAGEIKRLMVFMPPRHGKSELVSRQLPAFLLGLNPRIRIIATSYGASLASLMNRDVQRIIESAAYRVLFPETRLNDSNVRTSGNWLRNSDIFEIVGHGGQYRSAGVGGGITGVGADVCIIDDPTKNREEANSRVYRDKLYEWYTSTLYTRLEKNASLLLTVTRWHEDDLAGRLLAVDKNGNGEQWTVINFPAICEQSADFDIREPGDPLWPAKYDLNRLVKIRNTIGSRDWAALYQQRPAADGNTIVKKEWWKFYKTPPDRFDTVIQAWDLTFQDGQKSDYVSGVVLGKLGGNIYLLDIIRERLSFTNSIKAVKRMTEKWPQSTAKYVEKAANGHALIDVLKNEISGLIAVQPKGSKIARVESISPLIEAGNVYLPESHPLLTEILDEWTGFPFMAHDDMVDAMTYGIMKLKKTTGADWSPVSFTQVNKFGF